MNERLKSNPSAAWPALAVLGFAAAGALANPAGMTVVSGSVGAVAVGSQLDITAAHNAVINWQSFNIGAGETTTFHQPNNLSVVWNQIADQNPSQIWGHLNGNGIVVLMNQSGFYFGPNSCVNVGGFVAASAFVTPPASVGGMWSFQGPPPVASIINYGEIKANNGGSIFLVAEKIENHGILTAPDGTLGLYAGKEVLISERPDGRGLSVGVALPSGAIDNFGKISADAGAIALHARVVNQNGFIQADSVRERNGIIELVAGEALNLGAGSLITANGDSAGISAGGEITLKSSGNFSDATGSRIEARGGTQGGNGGSVEINAINIQALSSTVTINPSAQGGNGGNVVINALTIESLNLNVDAAALTGWSDGSLSLNSVSMFGQASANVTSGQISLTASKNIAFAGGASWNLSTITGQTSGQLTLEAGNNITFGNAASITDPNNWSVTLQAGYDFVNHVVQNGIGSIYLNGGIGLKLTGAIETTQGNISLQAGHDMLVGGGYVRTVGGGNISVTAGDGNVDAGTKADVYDYFPSGYVIHGYSATAANPSYDSGGIGTANGGNVSITAGNDISSIKANIGAFGAGAGNVNLTARNDIKGKFLVRNGVGTVFAGNNIGADSQGASFGLIAGGWNIKATLAAYINEIYNPNGSLNYNNMVVPSGAYPGNIGSDGTVTRPRIRSTFLFDYAPDAFVHITGGNSVSLIGNGVIHTSSNPARPAIYAPILEIAAGAGGVTLGSDVILFPSAEGHLDITTTGGGGLRSLPGRFSQLIISDSGLPGYTTFANDHAVTPVHAGQTAPVMTLDISGNLENVYLHSAGCSDIHIHGNALNASFEGQNLRADAVTRFVIAGNFSSRSDRTVVVLSDNAAAAFERIFGDPNQVSNPALAARLAYDPVTHKLTVQGIMTVADLNFLLNPTRYVWDNSIGQHLNPDGTPVIVADTFTADAAALNHLFAATQDIPTSSLARKGFQIGGPGAFVLAANNLDLGISSGIRSVGSLLNPALDTISAQGASIDISLAGNLDMTSSQIASFNGGHINVVGGGYMNVGSQSSFTSDDAPKGIYTGHGGSVMVHAVGDILVNSSRIASYDGGDVTVISDYGKMDAGDGANGFFYVPTRVLNLLTGLMETRNDHFYGSGIVALTGRNSLNPVGNIFIQAAGDISANQGGVLQFCFNPAVDQTHASVVVQTTGGSIHAGRSGIMGAANVSLTAPGGIDGFVVAANGNLDVHAQGNVNVTAFAGGAANVSGTTVSGIVVSGGNATVSGSEGMTASVISTGGAANGAEGTAFAGVTAPAAQKTVEGADKTLVASSATDEEEDKKKKGGDGKGAVLAQKVSRVTVILPKKS